MITLITPTGGRQEVFSICQHYMARQTFKGEMQWIIVNDVEEPVQFSDELLQQKHIKPELYVGPKLWRQGINTQRYNMDEAIKHVKGDVVFVIEDDDWYAPNYIEMQLFFLSRFDIVGQANSHYYNMGERKYKEWKNYTHTSLCETALRASKLDLLDRAVNSGQLFFDVALWQIVINEKHKYLLYDHIGLVHGLKGLPGKQGIGGGHFPDGSFTRDPNVQVLKEWVGLEDLQLYLNLIRPK